MKSESAAPKKKRGGKLLLFLLLALVCVGGMELIASYFFAPALFQAVTTPVKEAGAQAIQDFSAFLTRTTGENRQDIAAWADHLAEEKAHRDELEAQKAQYAAEALLETQKAIADVSITTFRTEGEQTILTGGRVPLVYFNQKDPAWAELPYGGSDTIGSYGCGPTVLAMVVSSLTDEVRNPVNMAQWAVAHHYWAPRSGSSYAIVPGVVDFGLVCTPIASLTPEAIRDALLEEALIVALMGPGHFTQGGHFVLLHGITLNGSILVADPNSPERSLMEWDAQLIIDELSRSRGSGAPLWAIQKPTA